MDIERFKANFQYGVRPTTYEMEIFGLPEKLKFLCKTSQLPGKVIGIIEVPFMGMKAKVGGDAVFEDLTTTIMLDSDFSVRNELESWMNAIRGNGNAIGDEPAIYKQTGSLIQLNHKGVVLAQYDFIGIWPNNLSPIELGFESTDQIAEYTVTWSYDYWLRVN